MHSSCSLTYRATPPPHLVGLSFLVESWLDERGHSLVPLSNPSFKLEMGLENDEHGTLLGR